MHTHRYTPCHSNRSDCAASTSLKLKEVIAICDLGTLCYTILALLPACYFRPFGLVLLQFVDLHCSHVLARLQVPCETAVLVRGVDALPAGLVAIELDDRLVDVVDQTATGRPAHTTYTMRIVVLCTRDLCTPLADDAHTLADDTHTHADDAHTLADDAHTLASLTS